MSGCQGSGVSECRGVRIWGAGCPLPTSNSQPRSSKVWQHPPAWSCCSSTSTLLPTLARVAAAARPPMPLPMTTASSSGGTRRELNPARERADGQRAPGRTDTRTDLGGTQHSPCFKTLSRARGSVTSGRGGPEGGRAKGLPAGARSRRATSPRASVPRATSSSRVVHMASAALSPWQRRSAQPWQIMDGGIMDAAPTAQRLRAAAA